MASPMAIVLGPEVPQAAFRAPLQEAAEHLHSVLRDVAGEAQGSLVDGSEELHLVL